MLAWDAAPSISDAAFESAEYEGIPRLVGGKFTWSLRRVLVRFTGNGEECHANSNGCGRALPDFTSLIVRAQIRRRRRVREAEAGEPTLGERITPESLTSAGGGAGA